MIEWLETKFNPIMIKEIYQGFRGRWFVIGYGLTLLISLGGYMTIVSLASPYNETLGAGLFMLLFFSMMLVALLIIPMSAGNQLRNEIISNTLDLIAITNLSPWAIIIGRFQAAGLKILLLFAYMGPFAIAAFLLGGIGITGILYSLGFLLLFSLGFCAFILMVNALPALSPRYKNLATTIQTLLMLFFIFPIVVTPFGRISFGAISWRWGTTEMLLSLYLLGVVSLFIVFFLRMAADMLTPPAIRTFMYAKLILMCLLMVMCLPFLKGFLFSSRTLGVEGTIIIFVVALFTLYFFALFWGGQLGTVHRSILHRLLGNGYTPTLVYVIVLTFGMSLLAAATSNRYSEDLLLVGLYCVTYYTFFSGLARMLRRFLKPEKRTAFVYLVLLLALIIFDGMVSLIYSGMMGGYAAAYTSSVILAFMPFVYFGSLSLFRHVGGEMLLPFIVGLFAAWLGREETAEP